MEKEKIRRLVLQAGQGDRAAFGELYEETGRSVYFNCLKLLGNAQQAEDITQDTFMKALEKLDSLKEPENFSAWVNRIAINNCKMYFRKNPRTAEEESEKIIDDTPDSELEMAVYTVSDEIKNADLSSGLVQLNGDIMQVGGYIKTSDFYAKYADEYSFVYCDGGHYEDKKGEMLNYRVGADNYFGGEWWDSYYMTLIPKVEPQGDEITVYVANLTNPDGQVSLADSYVVWAEETPMSNDIYTPAWIPTGMPTRLCYDVTSTKKLDEIYDNIDDYSAQSVQDMLASQGISKGENSISGNYLSYVYSQGDMSMSGTYCVNSDTDPDVFVAYVTGEKNAAGLTPLYRYHFAFDTNSKKLYESRMYLAGMF